MSIHRETFEDLSLLEKLRSLALLQQEMLKKALFIASQGPIEQDGRKFSCKLRDKKRRASTVLAMTAGQSLQTLLELSKKKGIPVRDCYPIGRSAVESFINAAFIVSCSEEVAERAIRHVDYAAWRLSNRKIGSGPLEINISSSCNRDEEIRERFPEFLKDRSWTKLTVPDRIKRIGEANSKKAAARLIAAYGIIYYLSSEIIHGSLFGASYFYTGFFDKEVSTEAFLSGTVRQTEEILIGVLHAGCGYLAAFYSWQGMDVLAQEEQRLFDLLLETATHLEKKKA